MGLKCKEGATVFCPGMAERLRVWGLERRVQDFGLTADGLGFKTQSLGFKLAKASTYHMKIV